MESMAHICPNTHREEKMKNKVLIVSFSFEQEPEAFEILREAGYDPVLWKNAEREGCGEDELIAYWNALPEKPIGLLMGADISISDDFFRTIMEKPKAISLNCAGYNHIDLNACEEHGVRICNVPRRNFLAVADLSWGLLLCLMRKIVTGDKSIRAGKWTEGVDRGMAVSAKTMGIIGFGAVGRAIAKRAVGFEMELIGYDIVEDESVKKEFGLRYVDRDTLLRESDIVMICAPANDATFHMIDKSAFEKMKRDAVVINTARGEVIDTNALIDALMERKIAGAGIDVYENEPLTESPLFALENTVLTPHIGGLADREIHDVAIQAAKNMVELLTSEQSDLGIV
jgi:D-3-phosphoglycerate dehydrogenase